MKFENYLKKKGLLNESGEYQSYQPLNENAGEEIMKLIKDMVNYAKLAPAYKKLKQQEYDLKYEKEEQLLDFDEAVDEKKDKAIETIKNKFKAEKEKLNQNAQMKPAQKKVAREKINQKLDLALKSAETSIKTRIDNEKTVLTKNLDKEIAEITKEITKLTTDYKPESSIMSAQWDTERTELDFELEIESLNKITELKADRIEDPERVEAMMKKSKDREAKKKKEAADEIAEAEAKEREVQDELDQKLANAEPEQKEALEKLRDFQALLISYPKAAKAAADAPEDDKLQDEANLEKKKFNDLKDKISAGLIKKSGMTTDSDEAEELALSFKNSAISLEKQMKDAGISVAGAASSEAKKIDDLKSKGYSETTEDKAALDGEKTSVTITDDQENETQEDKPKWKVQTVTKKDGTTVTFKKELKYDSKGKVTNETRKYKFPTIDSFFEEIGYGNYDNFSETNESRIVPTFESYVNKYW